MRPSSLKFILFYLTLSLALPFSVRAQSDSAKAKGPEETRGEIFRRESTVKPGEKLFSFQRYRSVTLSGDKADAKSAEADANSEKPTKPAADKTEADASTGKRVFVRDYSDLEGNLVVREVATYENSKLVAMSRERLRTNESGSYKIKGNKIEFEYKNSRGKVERDSEKIGSTPLVSADEIIVFLQSNWEKLLQDKELEIRFPVFDRLETVGFEFFKSGSQKIDGKNTIEITMKPSSFIIAALVDPLKFYFEENSKEFLLLSGRMTPKLKDGKDWKDFDGILKMTAAKTDSP